MEKWDQNKALILSVLILVILGSFFFLYQLRPVIIVIWSFLKEVIGPFFIATIISYILHPIVNLFSARMMPRSIAVLLIYTIFILSVVIVLINTIPMIQKQIIEIVNQIPEWNLRIQAMIQEYNDHGEEILPESVRRGLEQSMLKMEQSAGKWVGNLLTDLRATVNQIFVAFIVPFLAFYMLKDVNDIEKAFVKLLPKDRRREIVRLFRNIDQALGNYVRGQFLVCVIVFVLSYVGFWFIGLPYPLILASIIGITNIIPYLGPFIGAVPALLVALGISWKMVISVIIVNFIVQTLEGNVISPQIVGRTLHLHPMMIIFALLVGQYIGGVFGLILAVPVTAIIKVIGEHVIEHYIQRKMI